MLEHCKRFFALTKSSIAPQPPTPPFTDTGTSHFPPLSAIVTFYFSLMDFLKNQNIFNYF